MIAPPPLGSDVGPVTTLYTVEFGLFARAIARPWYPIHINVGFGTYGVDGHGWR